MIDTGKSGKCYNFSFSNYNTSKVLCRYINLITLSIPLNLFLNIQLQVFAKYSFAPLPILLKCISWKVRAYSYQTVHLPITRKTDETLQIWIFCNRLQRSTLCIFYFKLAPWNEFNILTRDFHNLFRDPLTDWNPEMNVVLFQSVYTLVVQNYSKNLPIYDFVLPKSLHIFHHK